MSESFSPALKALIQFAHQEAAESAQVSVFLDHLVSGYWRLHQLERLGVPFSSVLPLDSSADELPLDLDSQRVMQLAKELAQKRGDIHVDVVHVAAGIALFRRSRGN